MKFKAFIYLSVIAMLILMAVQYYFIKETFQTKEEQFDNKFSSLAKLGLYEFNSKYFDFEEDSLLSMLDEYCYFAINDPAFNSNDASHDSLFNDLVNEFIFQLNQAELKEIFLEKYFKSNNDTLTFSSYMHITDLQIIYFDQLIPVINDTLRFHHIPHKNVSHINSYITERNYFRISYDYYLSFSERKTLIRKEMMLTMLLSGITLLIVFLIFFLTLRNLWIHKRLSDLKTDFINNMTHELKTPLSTISVASSTLAIGGGRLEGKRVLELSNTIKKQNKHLSRLIDKILDISIWEKDEVKITPTEINIQDFFLSIEEDFKAAHPSISFKVYSEPDNSMSNKHSTFSLDEIHFTTVINNLLSNARKYGGENPQIILSYAINKDLKIHVSDTGEGIPSEEQKHVFEKFYRGKKTKRDAIKGLGLGLYYVKQIVEAHGGNITLESEKEKGSNFSIVIPGKNEYIIS